MLAGVIDAAWTRAFDDEAQRLRAQDELDERLGAWTAGQDKFDLQATLRGLPIPAAAVQKPQERIEQDPTTGNFGLWPSVQHTAMGDVQVDGMPVHFSETDWQMQHGAPCLGEHNEHVLTTLLGMSAEEVQQLTEEGVL